MPSVDVMHGCHSRVLSACVCHLWMSFMDVIYAWVPSMRGCLSWKAFMDDMIYVIYGWLLWMPIMEGICGDHMPCKESHSWMSFMQGVHRCHPWKTCMDVIHGRYLGCYMLSMERYSRMQSLGGIHRRHPCEASREAVHGRHP